MEKYVTSFPLSGFREIITYVSYRLLKCNKKDYDVFKNPKNEARTASAERSETAVCGLPEESCKNDCSNKEKRDRIKEEERECARRHIAELLLSHENFIEDKM